jgi:hypothetical protein
MLANKASPSQIKIKKVVHHNIRSALQKLCAFIALNTVSDYSDYEVDSDNNDDNNNIYLDV